MKTAAKELRFEEAARLRDMIKELKKAKVPDAEKYCDHTRFTDVIRCKTDKGEVYLVSVDSVEWALKKKYRVISENENIKVAFEFRNVLYATKFSVMCAAIKSLFNKFNSARRPYDKYFIRLP